MLQDATDEFNAIHSAKAKAMLNEYLIGRVGEAKAVQAKLPGIKEDEVSVIHLTLLTRRQEARHLHSVSNFGRLWWHQRP